MLHIEPDNEVWKARASKLGELMDEVWAAENERGFWQFKSTYFTSASVSSQTRYACDTPYHTRALQPLFLYWQRTNDSIAGERLIRWMDTWVDASLRTDRDKPSGVPPAAIAYPSGVTAGNSGPWYEPGCHITDDLFVYPRGMSLLLRARWHLRSFRRTTPNTSIAFDGLHRFVGRQSRRGLKSLKRGVLYGLGRRRDRHCGR